MNASRSQRIHRGFHRFGAVLAAMILVIGLIVVGTVAVEEANKDRLASLWTIKTVSTVYDIRLPSGTIVKNVPVDTTEQQVLMKLEDSGYDVKKLTTPPNGSDQPSTSILNFEGDTPSDDQKSNRRVYRVKGPDGKTYVLKGPEGATIEQLKAVIETNAIKQPITPAAEQPLYALLLFLITAITHIPLLLLAGFAAAAGAIYATSRGVGWIIAGFVGD